MSTCLRHLHWFGIACGIVLVAAGAIRQHASTSEANDPVTPARYQTPSHVPIESIRVGDRVLTGSAADHTGGTRVEAATWKHVTLRAQWTWPDGTEDIFSVETLQSPEWLAAHLAAIGRMVPLPLDVQEMGCPENLQGEIIGLKACPPIADGPGKVVLTTVNHLNPRCLELEVADARGVIDRIRTTDFHPFWSDTKQGWVQAYTLSIGDQLRGLDGERLTLESSRRIEGVHPVYNLTVEDKHVYGVGLSNLLAHNNCPRVPGGGGKGYRVMSPEEYKGASQGDWADSDLVKGDPTESGSKWLWSTEDEVKSWKDFIESHGEEGIITEVPTRQPLMDYPSYPHPPHQGTAIHVPIEELGPAVKK